MKFFIGYRQPYYESTCPNLYYIFCFSLVAVFISLRCVYKELGFLGGQTESKMSVWNLKYKVWVCWFYIAILYYFIALVKFPIKVHCIVVHLFDFKIVFFPTLCFFGLYMGIYCSNHALPELGTMVREPQPQPLQVSTIETMAMIPRYSEVSLSHYFA